jgi:GT2 family glycosyltransferase
MDDILAALEEIDADYPRHCAAAEDVAQEHFAHNVVLGRLLSDVGVDFPRTPHRGKARRGGDPFPAEMLIAPVSRRPIRLPDPTVEIAMKRPVPRGIEVAPLDSDAASIVVVAHENLVFTRLCLESVLANTREVGYELIVVDNGSRDATAEYLSALANRNANVRVVLNGDNLGFGRACNQGMALTRGDNLVLLNNDTMVPPGWLPRLLAHLEDPGVGLVGPVTNRIGNEAEIETAYRTWEEFVSFCHRHALEHGGEGIDIPVAAMFCLAMRREVFERLGPLDERYEVGLLEDDDYSERARRAGYRIRCADDVFVHHFGEASFGKLVPTGEYAEILRANKRRFAEKWGAPWKPYARRQSDGYRDLAERVRRLVAEQVPPGSRVLVVSRGDDRLLSLNGCEGLHFPQVENGVYAGHYPADSREAIAHLEELRSTRGANFLVFPHSGTWWLDHYAGLRRYLETRHRRVALEDGTAVIYSLNGSPGRGEGAR